MSSNLVPAGTEATPLQTECVAWLLLVFKGGRETSIRCEKQKFSKRPSFRFLGNSTEVPEDKWCSYCWLSQRQTSLQQEE